MAEEKTGVDRWRDTMGAPGRGAVRDDRKARRIALIALGVALVASIICCMPPNAQITRGLYLKGGTEMSLTATGAEGAAATSDELKAAASTIDGRMSKLGLAEYRVSATDDAIAVDVTSDVDTADLSSVVGRGHLEFVRVDEIGDADALEQINAGSTDVVLSSGTYTAFMDGSHVTSATTSEMGNGYYYLVLEFDEEGAQTFETVTGEVAEASGSVAVLLDGHVIASAGVSEAITGGGVSVTFQANALAAAGLAATLDSGELAVTTTVASTEACPALAGEHVTLYALIGCAVAAVAFFVVCWVRFKKMGLAGLSLAVFGILLLGLMAAASRVGMFSLTPIGALGCVLPAIGTVCATWLALTRCQAHVAGGGTVKGASLTAVSAALKPFVMPLSVLFVASCVCCFLPASAARDFGQMSVFSILCALAAVGWYAVTFMRLVCQGTAQADPTSWGLAVEGTNA